MVCTVISSEKNQEFGDVERITIPACDGECEILPSHTEAFIELKAGEVILVKDKQKFSIPVTLGLCYIKNDNIVVVQ